MAQVGVYEPDNLIAGDFQLITKGLTFGENIDIKRGHVIALNSSGEGEPYDSSGSGGVEIIYGILAEDVNTGAGENQKAIVYLQGQFSSNHVTFSNAPTDNVVSRFMEARVLNIYFTDTVAADNGITP